MAMMAPIRTTVHRPRRISLAACPAAAAEARNYVRATIHAWHVPIDPHVAVLLTSELVTNAITHEADDNETVLLIITWAGDQMRVEVHDTSRSEPVPVDAPPDAEAGRGLMLVATLSTDWGYYQTPAGKAVYFTLAPESDFDEGDDRDAQGDRHPQGGPNGQSAPNGQGGRDRQGDRRSLARSTATWGRFIY